jgi:hypothetical protein
MPPRHAVTNIRGEYTRAGGQLAAGQRHSAAGLFMMSRSCHRLHPVLFPSSLPNTTGTKLPAASAGHNPNEEPGIVRRASATRHPTNR